MDRYESDWKTTELKKLSQEGKDIYITRHQIYIVYRFKELGQEGGEEIYITRHRSRREIRQRFYLVSLNTIAENPPLLITTRKTLERFCVEVIC